MHATCPADTWLVGHGFHGTWPGSQSPMDASYPSENLQGGRWTVVFTAHNVDELPNAWVTVYCAT